MGKASRRKRERTETVPNGVTDSRVTAPGAMRRLRLILAIVAGTLVLAVAIWALMTADEPRPAAVPASSWLPDPDTSGMTTPVKRAIRDARRAALDRPRSARDIGRFGQVLHAHWLYDDAAACYERARDLNPEDVRWVYLLAGVEELRGAGGDRLDPLFAEVLSRLPDFAPAHVRYADALMRLGRWGEAREHYAAAVALDPDLVLAQRGLGQAAIQLGDPKEAVEHLNSAAERAPEDRITQVALARAYALAGDPERSAEASEMAQELRGEASLPDPIYYEMERLAVDPASLRSRFNRSFRTGDFDVAREAALLLEQSGSPEARQRLARAIKQQANQDAYAENFDTALAAFERAAELMPEDPEIQHNWGTVLLRQGDLEPAADHFRAAIELNPESADSLYNLGVTLEGLGRGEEAFALYERAAAIDPNHAAVGKLKGMSVAPDN